MTLPTGSSFIRKTDLEHASTDDGYVLLEQAYVDFLLSDAMNVRTGRVLAPVGIVNKKHEPTLFNGVERPIFSKYIIPTTWSTDGIGLFGNLNPAVSYEEYDTQDKMCSGIARDPAKDVEEVTFGVNFYPVSNFVIKADYQISEDASGNDRDDLFNMGIGWTF